MLKDNSGQLLLIGAFMLAMMVVTISLMLNNVIYASNLAYVGFMDQTRYDNLGFKQATADEMKYAYDNFHGTQAYDDYLTDYTNSVNRIINIEGKYVELDEANPVVPDPHMNTNPNNDQHILSVFSKSSKASYAISTGTNTPPASGYAITLTPEETSMTSDGIDTVKLTIHLTKNGADAPDELIVPESNRVRDFYFDLASGTEYKTDSNGVLILYYRDGLRGPGEAYITVYPQADSTVRGTATISCTAPAGAPSPFTITLSPQTYAPYPVLINDGVSCQQLTATVTLTDGGSPISGVYVRFQTNLGRIDDYHSNSFWITGSYGEPQWGIFYYGDQTQVLPYTADITAYIEETDPDTVSNHVYLNCQPYVPIADPTVDMAHSGVAGIPHSSDYAITVAFNIDPLLTTDINIDPSVIQVTDVTLDNPGPHYATNGGLKEIIITTRNIPSNKEYKIVLQVTFVGKTASGASYSKTGTLTIVGDNANLYWDAAKNPNYLTFP